MIHSKHGKKPILLILMQTSAMHKQAWYSAVCESSSPILTYPHTDMFAHSCFEILTGEHLLWTEQSSPSNLDPVVWPRAATSAEIYWTGATLPGGSPRNVETALPRLHDIAFRMQARGVAAIPLQPLWCALRPGVCDLTA